MIRLTVFLPGVLLTETYGLGPGPRCSWLYTLLAEQASRSLGRAKALKGSTFPDNRHPGVLVGSGEKPILEHRREQKWATLAKGRQGLWGV